MNYVYVPYHLFSGIMVAACIFLFVYLYKNKKTRGIVPFLIILASVIIWIAAQGLEFAAQKIETKIFWANVQYFPIMFLPVVYFIMVLLFTGYEKSLEKKWFMPSLMIIPVITNIMVWTNESHNLIRQNISLNLEGSFSTVSKTFGPLYWVFATYSFMLVMMSLSLILISIMEKNRINKYQLVSLFIGLFVPALATLYHVSGLSVFRHDLTPQSMSISIIAIFYGVFRHHLFDIIPVTRTVIIDEMDTGVMVLDSDGKIIDINRSCSAIFNINPEAAFGFDAKKVFIKYPELYGMFQNKDIGGIRTFSVVSDLPSYYEASFTKLEDKKGRLMGWLFLFSNVTANKKAENRIYHLAFHDHLTGLINRPMFYDIFMKEIQNAKVENKSLIVAIINIDDLKKVNDEFGHEEGDKVIKETAQRLKNVVRGSDIVSRLGADEFAVVLNGIIDYTGIGIITQRIHDVFNDNYIICNTLYPVKASMGVSVFPKDADSVEELMRKADFALSQAKMKGKNRIVMSS